MIHKRTLKALEFDRLLERLARFCQSDRGRDRVLALRPLEDETAILAAQRLYDESLTFASRGHAEALATGNFPDVSPLLEEVAKKGDRARLETDAFWALRSVLDQAFEFLKEASGDEGESLWPSLLALATARSLPQQLHHALLRCLGDDGNIRDEASPELFQVRSEIRGIHRTVLGKVRAYAERYNILGYLQDEFMTLSSDRYVLPFRASYKNRLQGIIHDWSQTGETCYFEPMFLVELNNRVQELKREEREEERKVLAFLAGLLEQNLDGAWAALDLLSELDVLRAKQTLAERVEGRMVPVSPVSEGISLEGARHPLLVLAEQDALAATGAKPSQVHKESLAHIRPLDITFRPGDLALVLSGGNAGGKTVCLKTLGLCAAMTLAGLPIPSAAGSHLPLFRRVDAFIGDEQSLEDNVSTFTAQIDHLAKAWKHLDASSLVLLDEFGSGTDPAQGAALAQGVLDELLAKKTFVLTATHFPALKSYALATEGARAASMLFDPDTHRPRYILAYDQVGASRALDVAREHGLPESILERARHYLLEAGEDTSHLLAKLNELALQRETELVELKKAQNDAKNAAKRYKERLEADRAKLHDEVRAKAQELMRAWKAEKATHKQALKQMAALRAELAKDMGGEEKKTEAPLDLAVGDSVTHTVFRKKGVVAEVDEKRRRVRLDMGGVSLWAEMDVLRVPGKANVQAGQEADPASAAPRGKVFGRVKEGPSTSDGQSMSAKHAREAAFVADLRGLRAEDALRELQANLDKAYLAEIRELEVVHGRGTGALRKAVHEFLSSCAQVDAYSLAPADRGGDGMTIVTLK